MFGKFFPLTTINICNSRVKFFNFPPLLVYRRKNNFICMKLKEKYCRMILDYMKTHSTKSFTVTEIGLICFSKDNKSCQNVSEFLIWLNNEDYITFTNPTGTILKRSNVPGKIINGHYQYKQGETIPFTEPILDLWKKETIKFIKQNGRYAYTTTEIGKEIFSNDIDFFNTQSVVMQILESEKVIYFNHQGKKTVKGKKELNGTWKYTNYVQAWR